MQSPFAARIDQAVADQRLQNVPPTGAFAGIWQAGSPKPVQCELLIESAGQPTCSPLPGSMQSHGVQANLYSMRLGMLGHGPFGRKQRQLLRALAALVKGVDDPTPCFSLTVVDLTQVKHLPLYDLAAGAALALYNVPIAMLFAILQASIALQVHARGLYERFAGKVGGWSRLHGPSTAASLNRLSFLLPSWQKTPFTASSREGWANRQRKTGRAVRFELTEVTRQALDDYLRESGRKAGQFLFPGRRQDQSLTNAPICSPCLPMHQWHWLGPAQVRNPFPCVGPRPRSSIGERGTYARCSFCFGIPALKVLCGTSASRSMMPSILQRGSRSELPGQSCRALPAGGCGPKVPGPT